MLATYAARVGQAVASGLAVILISDNPAALAAALKVAQGTSPLIYAVQDGNMDALASPGPAIHSAPGCSRRRVIWIALADLTQKLDAKGVKDLVLDPGTRGWGDSLAMATQLRRLALKKNLRAVGYPTITFPGEGAASADEEALLAAQSVAKYAGVIVLDHFDPALLYPLLTLRQNIYTDPQKPIQVSPGLYEIGNPKPESPLLGDYQLLADLLQRGR